MAIPYNPQAGQYSLSAAFTPVSATKAIDDAQTLASKGFDLQNKQDERSDKEAIHGYLRGGGSLYDQEGIDKAAETLKGKISSKAYMGLVDYGHKFKGWSMDVDEKLRALPGEKIDAIVKQNDFVLLNLEGAVSTYKKGITKRLADRNLTPDKAPAAEIEAAKQGAMEDFNATRQQQLQTIGSQLGSPDIIKQYSEMKPEDVEQAISRTKFFTERAKLAAQAQKDLAAAKKGDLPALIESIRAKPDMSDKDKQALINRITAVRGTAQQDLVANVQEAMENPFLSAHPDLQKRTLDKLLTVSGAGARGTPYPQMDEYQKTAAETMVWDWLLTGRRPSVRSPYYEAVAYRMHSLAAENKMSVEQLIEQGQDYKTRIQAKAFFERRVINIERASTTLERELPVLESAMAHIDLSKYPALSHIELAALRQLGDPNVTVMDQSARVILNEFQGIITGNVGGALNVSDVENSITEYKAMQTPQQMRAWINNAREIIKRAKAANEQTRTEWMGSAEKALHHRPGQPTGTTAPELSVPGTQQPPTGTMPAAPAAVTQPPTGITTPAPTAAVTQPPTVRPAVGTQPPTGVAIPGPQPPAATTKPSLVMEMEYDSNQNYVVGTPVYLKDGSRGVFVGKSPGNPTGVEITDEGEERN